MPGTTTFVRYPSRPESFVYHAPVRNGTVTPRRRPTPAPTVWTELLAGLVLLPACLLLLWSLAVMLDPL